MAIKLPLIDNIFPGASDALRGDKKQPQSPTLGSRISGWLGGFSPTVSFRNPFGEQTPYTPGSLTQKHQKPSSISQLTVEPPKYVSGARAAINQAYPLGTKIDEKGLLAPRTLADVIAGGKKKEPNIQYGPQVPPDGVLHFDRPSVAIRPSIRPQDQTGGSGVATGGAGASISQSGASGTPSVGTIPPAYPSTTGAVVPTPPATGSPVPPFEAELKGQISAEDFKSAREGGAALPAFLANLAQGISTGQQEYMATREGQQTSAASLEAARSGADVPGAMKEFEAVNADIRKFNSVIENMDQMVRRDLGPEVSESFVRAEVERRTRDMQYEYSRLQDRQNVAQARLTNSLQMSEQTFDALRADVTEKVNAAAQALGFKKENLQTSMELFTGIKQYEILNDYQVSQQRDQARAVASLLIQNPGAMSSFSTQVLAQIDEAAGFPVGMMGAVRSGIAQNETPLATQVDDAGALNMLLFNSATGEFRTKKFSDFATISQTSAATSASVAAMKLYSNAKQMGMFSDALSKFSEFAKIGDTETRTATVNQALNILSMDLAAKAAKGEATDGDWQFFRDIVSPLGKAAIGGSLTLEETADKMNSEFETLKSQMETIQ